MPIRHVKPQAALVATTRTQIGPTPMLGISVGVGFRLSDPAILVHEAAVWVALKAAAPSVPLTEAAMPKRCAEWLLAGHSVHHAPAHAHGRAVDWAAWVELDGVRKTVSCRAKADEQSEREACARLAIDHTQAVAGGLRENPLGIASGVAPLQRVGALGVGPEPLAAMGALASDWPERRQWMPSRPGTLEAMARDGTHMGWPERMDLRYFQQAAPDQWSRRDSWTPGARFELGGFGARGAGFAGTLPRLSAVALVTRTDRPGVEQVALLQQTVWLLPDHDIGVLWWNGSIPTEYVLDDAPAMLVTAVKEADERIDAGALMAFAAQRTDLTAADPTRHVDHALMPSVERGWTWELILDTEDHPRFSPPPRSRAEIGARLARFRSSLEEARDGQARLRAFQDTMKETALPVAPSDGHDWRKYFSEAGDTELRETTIRDADLSGLRFDGRRMEMVRFERCRFDRSAWTNCQLSHVHAVDCSFVNATLDDVTWRGGSLARSQLQGGAWRNVELQQISLEECTLDDIAITGGTWSMVLVRGRGGARGVVQDIAWDSVSWNEVDARDWTWRRVRAENLNLVECKVANLAVTQCTLTKSSALLSDLSESTWQRSTLSLTVLSHGTSIDRARFGDCVFQSCSVQALHAEALQVDHCTFVQLNAQHLKAERSSWTSTVLDGANAMYACLAGASFDRCSLKEAILYGADLRETRMRDCNLIRARTSWAYLPGMGAWQGNLNAGRIDVPRRGE
ncbi:type VI secretion protein [Burkholderia sp. SRS-46]|nr:type VI secretion protein [Burkholderia sp. SRS-46]